MFGLAEKRGITVKKFSHKNGKFHGGWAGHEDFHVSHMRRPWKASVMILSAMDYFVYCVM
jgi:hypothetical protein